MSCYGKKKSLKPDLVCFFAHNFAPQPALRYIKIQPSEQLDIVTCRWRFKIHPIHILNPHITILRKEKKTVMCCNLTLALYTCTWTYDPLKNDDIHIASWLNMERRFTSIWIFMFEFTSRNSWNKLNTFKHILKLLFK